MICYMGLVLKVIGIDCMWIWYCLFLLLAKYGCLSINLTDNGEIGLLFSFHSDG